ncbi:MAG: endonuclease MutS2 [Acidobacteriota bacterium]
MHQAFEILEFDKLKSLLLTKIRTSLGATLALRLEPLSGFEEIVRELRKTGEGVTILNEGTALDINEMPDPAGALARLTVEDVNLEPVEILNLLRLISVSTGLRETLREEAERLPLLSQIAATIPNLRALYQRLRGRILPNGEIDDFASPDLREARHNIARLRGQIQRSLESILKRADEAHALREDFVTIRNDRFVIPIRNDNRGAVAGVVHGMSSSGQTAFVEPLETIEMNNELVRLRELEQIEITKVLFGITEELRAERSELEKMADAVAEIDFVAARARLSIAMTAIEPEINQSGRLFLNAARHPLLEEHLKSQSIGIVPISLELDADHPVMVISGPNAGGKTVVLKTVGLLLLMAQSGLHVPAAEADLPVFTQIHPDIGDHQSIAANLSTFTAHIENIRQISAELEAPAIVLLDEVGTGTDPEEGAALGVAIVDYFKSRGAHVIVTTHYGALKVYATNRPDVLNASVEFDERTLKPTYRLLTGLAGASSGIEIARRFGLPAEITERAVSGVATASVEATNFLRRLKQQYDEQQQSLLAIAEERAAVAEKYGRLEADFSVRERARERDFRNELQKIVAAFTERGEKLIASITDATEARRARKDLEKKTIELRSASSTAARLFHQQAGADPSGKSGKSREDTETENDLAAAEAAKSLEVGDRVLVLAFGQEGVVDSVTELEVGVQVGALRFREQPENLRLVERAKASNQTARTAAMPKGVSVSLSEREAPRNELKLLGQTVAEATDATDKFLDEAFLNNYDRVRIVHGVGMGALKRAVTELLTGHPHVEKFYSAASNEGGNGATVVELRK